jgi:hypothetical protein
MTGVGRESPRVIMNSMTSEIHRADGYSHRVPYSTFAWFSFLPLVDYFVIHHFSFFKELNWRAIFQYRFLLTGGVASMNTAWHWKALIFKGLTHILHVK